MATAPAPVLRRVPPIVHFLILGSLLFVADRWRGSLAPPEPPPIVVSADEVAALRRGWHEQFGSEPTAAEERSLVRQAVDEEVLYREAVAAGLDRGDRIVRARLLELARFLRLAPDDDQPALIAAADRLGLEGQDVLLHRHLAEMARLVLAKGSPADLPSEAELRAYYEGHAASFMQPTRLEFRHVFLSAQRRGARLTDDAHDVLDELRRQRVDPAHAGSFGDPFIDGTHIGLSSRPEIERLFGSDFARAVEHVATGAWAGPIRSSYGLHLVWVERAVGMQRAPYDSVRNQVLHAALRERAAQRLQERLAIVRQRYRLEIAGQS